MTKIIPSIGRVVLVRQAGQNMGPSDRPFPAFINFVWSDTRINVAGFNKYGTPFAITSIRLIGADEPLPVDSTESYAHWMEYQINQAIKHEAPPEQPQAEAQAPAAT